VPAEGGAMLILEDLDTALDRGAPRIYGEVAGYAATFDPKPGTGREPALGKAIQGALRDAELEPGEVDVVFADAAGTPALDRVEADAVTGVFGADAVPVTAPKTMTGRLYAGAASLDAAAALLAMRDNVIPPTTRVRPDPSYRLDLVTGRPRTAEVRAALVIARGHGGFNSAIVLRAPAYEWEGHHVGTPDARRPQADSVGGRRR
jgi:act minimal PKS chain-length factor (CLF/KS beta)